MAVLGQETYWHSSTQALERSDAPLVKIRNSAQEMLHSSQEDDKGIEAGIRGSHSQDVECAPDVQKVISQRQPRVPKTPNTKHHYLTVITFQPHPQEFFTGQPRSLLTPLSEKAACIQSLGVDQLILLPFNHDLARLSPEKFVEQILVQSLQAKQISVGFDFRFGCQRAGTAVELRAIAATYGIQVMIVPPQTCEGERISSSAIRQALQQGNLQQANRLLGRPYNLVGQVVRGQQLGQQLGFPTANLQVPAEKYLPCRGVYCVRVRSSILKQPQIGVMNVGYRPTVDGTQQVIEIHLLDWSGNLYDQMLTVHLDQFLRPEQRFADLEALKAQIQADCIAARTYYQTAI